MVGLSVERDRLEAHLRQADKMKALGVLAGGIAHDFNNMLSAVLGNAELALEMLEDIVAATGSATELCGQMLAYAGLGAFSPEPVECNALVTELGGLLQVALSKKASLLYDLHDTPLHAKADPSQIRQVVMNLLTSGFLEQSVRDRLETDGFAGFVQKPATRRLLLDEIANALPE